MFPAKYLNIKTNFFLSLLIFVGRICESIRKYEITGTRLARQTVKLKKRYSFEKLRRCYWSNKIKKSDQISLLLLIVRSAIKRRLRMFVRFVGNYIGEEMRRIRIVQRRVKRGK